MENDMSCTMKYLLGKLKAFLAALVPFRVLRHFTHKNAEANVHDADWLMGTYINEFGFQGPNLCMQSTMSVRAAVPKDYERNLKI